MAKKRKIIAKKKARARRVKKVLRKAKHIKVKTPRYVLNSNYEFYDELRNLILKSSPAEIDRMITKISGLGKVRLAIISGLFLNESTGGEIADLFIVGDDINKDRLRSFLKALEAEVGKEIKFSLMEKDEFQYRFGMFDRFVRVLLEGPHEKIINKLGI
jgi:hypothetical protein